MKSVPAVAFTFLIGCAVPSSPPDERETERMLDTLEADLRGGRDDEALAVRVAVAGIGNAAVGPLWSRLRRTSDPDLRVALVEALADIPGARSTAVLRQSAFDPRFGAAGAMALGEIARRRSRLELSAVERAALKEILDRAGAGRAGDALRVLARSGSLSGEEMLRAAEERLTGAREVASERRVFLESWCRAGEDLGLEAFQAPAPNGSRWIWVARGRLGDPASSEPLRAILRNAAEDVLLRCEAARTLARVGREAARPVLEALLAGESERDRVGIPQAGVDPLVLAAREALQTLGPPPPLVERRDTR